MVYRLGWRQHLQPLSAWVLTPRCLVCGVVGERSSPDLCDACYQLLPVNEHACIRCALPLDGEGELVCGECLQRPPRSERAYCAFEYAYPLEHLIRRCKYGHALSLTKVLGHLLAAYLQRHHTQEWPQCFVPVPLHSARYLQRGFNQVIEMGRWLERELAIPMRPELLVRQRNTSEQAGLSRSARRKNLRRAFAVATVAMPKQVAVLDDVMTTGSTLDEAVKILKQAGVERVEVWALARATLHAV